METQAGTAQGFSTADEDEETITFDASVMLDTPNNLEVQEQTSCKEFKLACTFLAFIRAM